MTINNDTVYSMTQIDLSVGPVQLSVPDTQGRYYVLQFVDAWTDNFAYVGHRATGTEAGEFLLVPPGWSGDAPVDATVFELPTLVASIVGRWACAGEYDLPAIIALRGARTLTPFDPDAVAAGIPVAAASDSDALVFFDKLRLWSRAFPGAERDRPLQESLSPLGVNGDKPLTEADAATVAALEAGALDDSDFKITDPKVRIVERAASAAGGLWGNHAYEAAYIMTYVDDQGEQLTGSRTYTLHLNPTPPVGAFWSLTMYDVPNFFMVDNPIDRYSIADRTPGIVYEHDGSLVITISHDEPVEPTARANWLPAPAGDFRPVLRMYEPDAAVVDGKYETVAITRS